MKTNLTIVKAIIYSFNDILTAPINQSYFHIKKLNAGEVTHILSIKHHMIGNYYTVVTYHNHRYSEFKVSRTGFDLICNMIDQHDIAVQSKICHINKTIEETESFIDDMIKRDKVKLLQRMVKENDADIEGLSNEFIKDIKKYIDFDYPRYSAYLEKIKLVENILSSVEIKD